MQALVENISALLGCYAARSGKSLPNIRGKPIYPIFRAQELFKVFEDRQIILYFLIPEGAT
jgi:hypothetical protein